MKDLKIALEEIVAAKASKMIISKSAKKAAEYKKLTVEKKQSGY